MPLFFAILLSLLLHLALFAAPSWLLSVRQAKEPARLEVKLMPAEQPPVPPPDVVDEISTRASENHTPPVLATAKHIAQTPRGSSLQRAQTALAKHLLYPPQAVAQGLQGEVTLLLVLDERGRILSAEVARSSGHAILDQAALEAAGQLPALPGSPRQTLLPVNFSLQ